MKRVLIIILLILSILLGYSLVTKGFSNDKMEFSVSSYNDIGDQSEVLTMAVAAYNKKNDKEYQTILNNLNSSITKYEKTKGEYEDLIAEIGSTEEVTNEEDDIVVVPSLTVYEIDFLWATIGNYAKKEGLTITMDVNKSSASTESLGYGLYNLSFSVSGQYINIANFLYHLEDDDKLGFEIRNYSMTSGSATFTIYNVPLNSDSLLDNSVTLTETDGTETTEGGEQSTEENSNTANTVGTETVTSNNTTNTDNTTNSTNTVNNTTNVTNNTTN